MVEFWGKQPLVAYILCIKLNFYAAQRASYAKISRNEFLLFIFFFFYRLLLQCRR